MSRVAVVGGGIGGLSVARALLAAGVDVEVFEASSRPGGVIETSSADGFAREHAANGALSGAPDGALELAAELGLEVDMASPAAKNRWIFADGRLQLLPTNPLALARSHLLSAGAKMRLLLEPLRPPLRGEPTVAEFFRHRLGDEVHDRVVAPFVAGVFAGNTEELSLEAAFPKIAEIAGRGGLARGLLARQLSARRAGKRRPASRLGAPAGGMGRLIGALAAELDTRIRLESPVAAIAGGAGGAELTLASGALEKFDCAVCATPATAAAPLLGDADGELGEDLAAIPSAPVAVVHLGYARERVGHALDGFGFLVAPGEALPILGIVFESTLWPDRAPAGAVLIRCMLGGARRPEIMAESDEALIRQATGAAAEVLDITGEPVHANLVRWPRAISQYIVGHRERVARVEELAAAQHTVLAGGSYHGVAVNAIAADAKRVVRRVGELLAAPLAMLLCAALAASLAACSSPGTQKPAAAPGDGGAEVGGDGAGVDEAGGSGTAPGYRVTDAGGAIRVTVRYPDPPAAAVREGAVDRCGEARRPRLVVHTMGGVSGAAVWLEDVSAGRAPPARARRRLTYRRCRLEPRVVALPRLGGALEVVTAAAPRVELTLAPATGEAVARLPMAPIGRGFARSMKQPGVYRVAGDGVDPSWAVVSGTPYLAITNARGQVRFDGLPDGHYQVKAWHPPLTEGGAPLTRIAAVELADGEPAEVAIELGP